MGSTRKVDLAAWRARMPDDVKDVYERYREEVDAYRFGSSALGEHLVRDQTLLSPQGRYIAVEDRDRLQI